MYAALHFPNFSLNVLLARQAQLADQPVALLSQGEREKAHLLALNEVALRYSVTPGMKATQALARCPELHFLTPDSAAEKARQEELLVFAESITPDFEATAPEPILLDLATVVYADEAEWRTRTMDAASYLNLPMRLATAPTPDLAHLRALGLSQLTALAEVPLFSFLDLRVLKLWGIGTLTDLAALPRQGLAERLGKEVAWLHDVIHGKTDRLLRLTRPAEDYQASHSFEPAVENFEPILFIARRLLQTLCHRLRSQQRAAASVQVHLGYENGAAHAKELILSEASLEPDILLRSLHTHLDSLKAPSRIEDFHLSLKATLPGHFQHDIFRQGLRDPHQFANTLQRLTSLVGIDRLGIPQLNDSHRPDDLRLHALTPDLSEITSADVERFSLLPMSRFRPPFSVHVLTEKRGRFDRPLAVRTGPYQGKVIELAGPYPVSGQWWDRLWQELQWDVELDHHQLLQLTQQSRDTWVLTGIYGG